MKLKLGAVAGLLAAAGSAMAIDYTSATNSVATMGNAVNDSSDILLPIGVGLTMVFAAWGLFKKFGSKAGARA